MANNTTIVRHKNMTHLSVQLGKLEVCTPLHFSHSFPLGLLFLRPKFHMDATGFPHGENVQPVQS